MTILNAYRRDAQIQWNGTALLEVNRFCNVIQDYVAVTLCVIRLSEW